MPDFQNYQMQVQPDFNPGVAIPRIRFSLRVTDSQTGAVLQDFTGANAIDFLFRVQGFTAAQHKILAEFIAHKIVRLKAGLDVD